MKKGMPTERDVRYALQYDHQELVRTYDDLRRPAEQYHLQPSGVRVDKSIANAIRGAGYDKV